MKRLIFLLLVLVSISVCLRADMKQLTFDQVYLDEGEKIMAKLPANEEWLDGEFFIVTEDDKLYRITAANGKKELFLDPTVYQDILGDNFDLLDPAGQSSDRQKFLFVDNDDIFFFNRQAKTIEQLTKTTGKEKNPVFSPDAQRFAYTLDGNLYVYDLAARKSVQLTFDGSAGILNGESSYVYHEEIIGRHENFKAFWWSEDNRKIVFMRFDQSKVPVFPIFKANGIYGELEQQRYPKPGYPNPSVQLGIADVAQALKKNENVNPEDNKKNSAAVIEWIPFTDVNDHYLAFPTWNEAGNRVYFQWLNRGQDHLKLLVYDLETKKIRQLYEEQQKTWVDFLEKDDLHILKNGSVVLRSSQDGWYHLYLVSAAGRKQQLTKGDWSAARIAYVDGKRGTVYFTAAKEDSTGTDLYRVDFTGKRLTRLTDGHGSHAVTIAPGGKYFIDTHSTIDRPQRMDLLDIKGKLIRTIADEYLPVMKEYGLAKVELFRIPTKDGYQLPALWLLPPGLDKNGSRKYPVVFEIYGGPGAPSVRNRFPRLGRFLTAQHDIIVISVDHRGSGHFGKKGIDLMYRCLGKWEMQDYGEAVSYLGTLPFVDGGKIGITGGSYGGYATALALTKGSEFFYCGIAGASVIDWRLYDSTYTERYMDTPEENPDGYENASVLHYIDGYRSGSLRVDHGMIDDNVHMQNTVQLVDAVLDAGKSLEVMFYPGQRHGYRGKKRDDSNRADLDFWLRQFYSPSK